MRTCRLFALLTAYWVLSTGYCAAQQSVSIHLTMGNPSQAVHNAAVRDNYLVVRDEYAYSFNSTTGLCNWVSWRLAGDDVGDADRAGLDFSRDDELPESFPRIPVQLYAASGFDKGHVCPSKDRSRRSPGQKMTFKLPNCLPQAPALNRGPWGQHEEHRRTLAGEGNELYIVAGPAGRGGQGEKGFRQSLGRSGFTWSPQTPNNGFEVPAWCWAVCLVLDDKPGNDLERVHKATPALAVIMPNTQAIEGHWQKFCVRIRDVEELTGLELFDLVDEDVQESIELRLPVEPENAK